METYLNIRGEEDLIEYIKKTWSSAYFIEAITYRMNKGLGISLEHRGRRAEDGQFKSFRRHLHPESTER
jgi:hypothetical protein